MTDPSGTPAVEEERRAAARDAPSLTPEEREEVEQDLKVMLEQRREYAFPGRLHVEGEHEDRARIRAILDREIARAKALLE